MPKSAQEHLFGAHHFGVVSLRGTFYLLIVPLPHRGICKGAATPVVAPFWAFFASCVTQGSKETPFCFLRNAGPEKDPLFASCATQGPKKTLFCFLHNAGPEKDPLFVSCTTQGSEKDPFLLPAQRRARKRPSFCFLRCAGSKKGLISRGGKAFHETGDWLCDFRHRFRATPCPRDSAPSVHSHFHAYFCRSFG